jgi:serine/threonine protein kinase
MKLENILVDAHGNIKIVDFGLSNFMKDGQFLKTGCGSLHYAPPEIIMGKPYTGAEVDTWSCGVILYAMLTGYLPFDDDNHSDLVKRICTGNFTIPESVSPGAADLIRSMLKVHPLERIKLSDIKRHNWFTATDRAAYVLQDMGGKEDQYKISPQILNKLLSLQFDFKGMDLSEIKDSIRCKKNLSFVIGYQLLEDEHKREMMVKNPQEDQLYFGYVKRLLDQNVREINDFYMELLSSRQNAISNTHGQNAPWQYGLMYQVSESGVVMNTILEALGSMGVAFIIKGSNYCLKCASGDPNTGNNSSIEFIL